MSKKLVVSPLAGALALVLSLPAFAEPAPEPAADAASDQAKNLDSIEVHGQRGPEVSSPKFTQPLLDTPQSITVVPAELMQEQGVTTLRDALRNVPGISMQAGEGGVPAGDNLTLRGFSARTDLFVDGVRDFGGYSRDPFNLEQIEVVKGPASTHSGRGSTGGSINLASKVAREGKFSNGSISAGDNGLVRATADINQSIGENSAFRINFLGHSDEVNGRDAVENKRWGVAPSLSFGLGTDTVTSISLFHLEQDNIPDYGLPWVPGTNTALPDSQNGPAPVDRSNFYGLLDRDYEKTQTDIATVNLQHSFNEDLSLRNITRFGRGTRDSIITAPRFAADNSTQISRTAKTRDSEDTIAANVTDVTFRFESGGITHTLVAGLELTREKSSNLARTATNGTDADLFNPDFNAPYTGTITATGRTKAGADSAAVYAFDTLEINPQWELSGGLRWDYFDVEYSNRHFDDASEDRFSSTDTMLSGRVGVVFKPRENGSIYFGYGTSFNPSAEGLTLSETVENLDPEESRTAELGTKWNLFGQKLMLTAAVFRTEKTNARTPDPIDPAITVLQGKQRVDGFEIGLAGRITDRWTISGGYAFLDSKVLETNDSREKEGNELGNTPRNSASLWTTYEFTDNFEAGLGAQHVGARWTNNREERQAKSYTVYDAMLGYRFSEVFALRLNGYNLSNKFYIDRVGGGHYLPGAERTLVLSADFRF
jgi:catecholate siderophore receptor